MRLLLLPVLLCLTGQGTAKAQDALAGEKVFTPCKACHQIGEGAGNAIGPSLNGIIGRKAGTYPDYGYSNANKASGLTWDEATFRDYIRDPRAKVPGTKMTYVGVKDDKRIDNLLAYLKQFDVAGKKAVQ